MDFSKLNLLKNLTLLLVEDDEELINNLNETLSIFFKKIIIARNGKEAFDFYNLEKIDLIITDYVVPELNGFELCKMIRNTNNKIPLTIISNYSDKEKLLKSIPLELTNYLIKPIEYEQLITTLLVMLEKINKNTLNYFILDSHKKYSFLSKEIINEKENSKVKLTKSEITIIELLIENINKVVKTEVIEYSLSPNDAKSEQAIKNIIHRLRNKLTKNSISNIQGIGYILNCNTNV